MANLIVLVAPLAVGAILGILLPGALTNPLGYLCTALALIGMGLAGVVSAKVQNFRKGKLITFGSKEMSRRQKRMYWAGYVLIMAGALVVMALAVSWSLHQ